MTHTHTPWRTRTGESINKIDITPENSVFKIATAKMFAHNIDEVKANATHIVKCVNLHDELVEAIKDAHPYITSDALRATIGDLIVKAEATNA